MWHPWMSRMNGLRKFEYGPSDAGADPPCPPGDGGDNDLLVVSRQAMRDAVLDSIGLPGRCRRA
jgi:hypothetical protein